jgi:hypothetical protein
MRVTHKVTFEQYSQESAVKQIKHLANKCNVSILDIVCIGKMNELMVDVKHYSEWFKCELIEFFSVYTYK